MDSESALSHAGYSHEGQDLLVPTIVRSAVCHAMDTALMEIESSFTRGYAGMQLIGNMTEVCRDGKERAKAALESMGIVIPAKRLIVSLAPADIRKDGNHLDLPIAVSLALLITQATPRINPARWLFAAEVGLSGELKPTRGIVSFGIAAAAAGLDGIVASCENQPELSVLADVRSPQFQHLKVKSFARLQEVLGWMFGESGAGDGEVGSGGAAFEAEERHADPRAPDFDDMILTPQLELAALTACAGMHNMLLRGTPGTGKSMLSARLPSIMPPMVRTEHVEAMRIHSSYSERLPASLLAARPSYRAPHHQASASALLGGADSPGELSLAHGGILFLDEFPEFRRDLLEALREPLETGEVRVSRSKRKILWKARVTLVAACNNCPCGWFGSRRRRCSCPTPKLHAYWQRLSGPLLDRIDLHINVPELKEATASLFVALAKSGATSRTATMAARVVEARALAASRNALVGAEFNRDIQPKHLVQVSGLAADDFADLVNTVIPKSSSSRAVLRTLRVARTLADLAASPVVRLQDLTQAWAWQAEPAAVARGEMLG